jgi:hypothetical protein
MARQSEIETHGRRAVDAKATKNARKEYGKNLKAMAKTIGFGLAAETGKIPAKGQRNLGHGGGKRGLAKSRDRMAKLSRRQNRGR